MALKDIVAEMKELLREITHDLDKSERGVKAASQRVRTNTIKFAKTAKHYRKESISEGRKKKPSASKKAPAKAKKAAPKKKAKKR